MFPANAPEQPLPGITAPPTLYASAPAPTFGDLLRALTPVIYVTYVILAINVAVFIAMALSGAGLFDPTPDSLLRWGANFGPRTTNGEWWRLATSMFLHIGLMHIAFNMVVLLQIGPLMERILGNAGFTVAYLVSGLGGALASVAWNPYVVSAGASGAIFGLYGALLGFLALRPKAVPQEVLSGLVKGALAFIGYNVVYGFIRAGTDMAAHAGGLATGFLCGMALSLPLTIDDRPRRSGRNALLAVSAALLLSLVALKLPHSVDLQARLREFGAVEKSTLASYNQALQQFVGGKLKAPDFAALVEKTLLPDWNAQGESLSKLRGLPDRQTRLVALLVKYIGLRGDGWAMLAAGLREDRQDKIKQAMDKQKEASTVVTEISQFSDSAKRTAGQQPK